MNTREVVHVYTQAWNEEQLLPYFLKHYETFATRIVVCDQQSDDRTREIVKAHPLCEHRLVGNDSGFAEQLKTASKATVWQESRGVANWVIVVDTDELIYHDHILEYLNQQRRQGISGLCPVGYDMVSLRFPTTSGQIYSEVTRGCFNRAYSKPVVFDPNSVSTVIFDNGCHAGTFFGTGRFECKSELRLLHMKNLGQEYLLSRNRQLACRIPLADLQHGINAHYFKLPSELRAGYGKLCRRSGLQPDLPGEPQIGNHTPVESVQRQGAIEGSRSPGGLWLDLSHPKILFVNHEECVGLTAQFGELYFEMVLWSKERDAAAQQLPQLAGDWYHPKLRAMLADCSVLVLCGQGEEAQIAAQMAAELAIPTVLHVSAMQPWMSHEANCYCFSYPSYARSWVDHLLEDTVLAQRMGRQAYTDWSASVPPEKEHKANLAVSHRQPRLQVVVVAESQCPKAQRLYAELSKCFANVDRVDAQAIGTWSQRLSNPRCLRTDAWRYVVDRYPDAGLVWMIDGNVELQNPVADYFASHDSLFTVGCWSPSIHGGSQEVKQSTGLAHTLGDSPAIQDVALMASMDVIRRAVAIAREREVEIDGALLCAAAAELHRSVVIDRHVAVHWCDSWQSVAPAGDKSSQAETTPAITSSASVTNGSSSGAAQSPGFNRRGSCESLVGIVGTQIGELVELLATTVDATFVVGPNELSALGDFPPARLQPREMRYASAFIDGLDALFVSDLRTCPTSLVSEALCAGVPVVMREGLDDGLLVHEQSGFYFRTSEWGLRWLSKLLDDAALHGTISMAAKARASINKVAGPNFDIQQRLRDIIKVSIITPTFHRDLAILRRCIESVKAQAFSQWEHLICSDGEFEPGVAELVCRQHDSRISYYRTSKWRGDFGPSVRNAMLVVARGQYACFLDDDNILLPGYLDRMVSAIEGQMADFAICGCLHFGPLARQAGPLPIVLSGVPPVRGSIDTLQVVCKTGVIRDIGWDENEGYFSDGATYERLAERSSYAVVPEVLAVHL